MVEDEYKQYRFSRAMVIADATLEYLVTLLLTDSFLANATRAIGISDALTGILSTFISLSSVAMIISLFFAKKTPYKIWTTTLVVIGELMFALLYVVPVIDLAKEVKTVVFALLLLFGYITLKIAVSPRNTWQLSLISPNGRGKFESAKEITSLIAGMLFSLGAGYFIDTLRERGEENKAFVVIALAIVVIVGIRLISIILTKEPKTEAEQLRVGDMVKTVLRDKTALKVMAVPVMYEAFIHLANPFLGAYKINDLGLDLTFISIMSMAYSIVRSLVSPLMGRIGDRKGFAHLFMVGIPFYILAYAMMFSADASNAKIFVTLYYVFYAIAIAGINMSSMFIVFDYVPREVRLGVYTLYNVALGILSFLATLVAAIPIGAIQKAGGLTLFGHSFRAQQVMIVCSVVGLLVLLTYLAVVVKKIKIKR